MAESLPTRKKLTADRRAWMPREVGDALVAAGHASYDANSGTFYVRGSTLDLIPSAVRGQKAASS